MSGTVSYLKAAGQGFLPADDGAYSEILRYSSCIAEDRDRLTTELSLLGDLLEESNLKAMERKSRSIGRNDVEEALEARSWHASLSEETINEEINSAKALGYDLSVVAIKARENLTSMGIEEFFGEDTLAFDAPNGDIYVVLPLYNENEARFALRMYNPIAVAEYKDGDASKLLKTLQKALK